MQLFLRKRTAYIVPGITVPSLYQMISVISKGLYSLQQKDQKKKKKKHNDTDQANKNRKQ